MGARRNGTTRTEAGRTGGKRKRAPMFVRWLVGLNLVMIVVILVHDVRSHELSRLYEAPAPLLPRPEGMAADNPALTAARRFAQEIHHEGPAAFAFCNLCHSLGDGTNRYGPNMHCLASRSAAGREGYRYSPALIAHAERIGHWSLRELFEFIDAPSAVAPGARMPFPGLDDGAAIRTVIEHMHWSCDEVAPELSTMRLVSLAGGECTDIAFAAWPGWADGHSPEKAIELMRGEEERLVLPAPAPSGDHCVR